MLLVDVEHFRKCFPEVGKIVIRERGEAITSSNPKCPEAIENRLVVLSRL